MVPVCIRNQWSMALGLLVGSGLWACLSAQAEAHAGSRVFPVPELTDEMLNRFNSTTARWKSGSIGSANPP